MSVQHTRVRDVLAAWALGACPPDEADAVTEHLATCPGCATEAARLQQAAAGLGAGEEHPPPSRLRNRVLATALARHPDPPARQPAPTAGGGSRSAGPRGAVGRAGPLPAAAEPYAAEVTRLDALLRGLAPEQWRTAVVHGWDVQDTVLHLAGVDGLLASQLGLPDETPGNAGGEDLQGRTAAAIAHGRQQRPEQTRATWRAQADAILGQVTRHGRRALDRPVVFAGLSQPVWQVLLDRAFETWIHADDLRLALGLPARPPAPGHMAMLADLGVRMLPLGLRLLDAQRPGQSALVVLEGPGGGRWIVPLGPGPSSGTPDVTLTTDVAEFCRLIGGRRTPGSLATTVEGAADLAADLLHAAMTLSRQ
jgi:uncharacterized protein (TIGR03083 family)